MIISNYFIDEIRFNFGLIYNLLREVQEVNHFLDDLLVQEKLKIKQAKALFSKQAFLKQAPVSAVEVVESVPDVDSILLDLESSEDTVTDTFIESKKQQLLLWQERVHQRKVQKEEQLKMQRASIEEERIKEEQDDIEFENANQLHVLYKNIDEGDKLLYHTLFKSDPSCKPHNVRFRDIEKLIKNFGGAIERDTGSSHFTIHLPDTHHIWAQADLNSTVSYMDIPQATGGSYKPHHSDEWSRSAHYFLQQAFVKAGITPPRLAKAEQMLKKCPSSSSLEFKN